MRCYTKKGARISTGHPTGVDLPSRRFWILEQKNWLQQEGPSSYRVYDHLRTDVDVFMEWKRLKDLQLNSPGKTPHSLCCIQVCQKNKKTKLHWLIKQQQKKHKESSINCTLMWHPSQPPTTIPSIYIQWLCPGWNIESHKSASKAEHRNFSFDCRDTNKFSVASESSLSLIPIWKQL